MSLHTGNTLGGILAASLGNTTSIMVGTFALFRTQVIVATSFLTGSLLLNLLLIIGTSKSYLFQKKKKNGNRWRAEQRPRFFSGGNLQDRAAFQHNGCTDSKQPITAGRLHNANPNRVYSILRLYVIPSRMLCRFHLCNRRLAASSATLKLSQATSIILLVVYGFSLIFELKIHALMYNLPPSVVRKRRTTPATGRRTRHRAMMEPEDDSEICQLSKWTAILTVCISGGLIGICSMGLLDSTAVVVNSYPISGSFVRFPAGQITSHAYADLLRLGSLYFLWLYM